MMKEIRKTQFPLTVFQKTDEWETPDIEHQYEIVRALDHPVRRGILEFLNEGDIRQINLAKMISEKLGKRITAALLRHHLAVLERAGLISYKLNGRWTKMVRKALDFRVQVKPRNEEQPTTNSLMTTEKFMGELRRILNTTAELLEERR